MSEQIKLQLKVGGIVIGICVLLLIFLHSKPLNPHKITTSPYTSKISFISAITNEQYKTQNEYGEDSLLTIPDVQNVQPIIDPEIQQLPTKVQDIKAEIKDLTEKVNGVNQNVSNIAIPEMPKVLTEEEIDTAVCTAMDRWYAKKVAENKAKKEQEQKEAEQKEQEQKKETKESPLPTSNANQILPPAPTLQNTSRIQSQCPNGRCPVNY